MLCASVLLWPGSRESAAHHVRGPWVARLASRAEQPCPRRTLDRSSARDRAVNETSGHKGSWSSVLGTSSCLQQARWVGHDQGSKGYR